MRMIKTRKIAQIIHHSPTEAIWASKNTDLMTRSVLDDQVRGREIRRIFWDDTRISIALDCGQYLNIVAHSDGIGCSLADSPAAFNCTSENTVLLEIDGNIIEWHRDDVAYKYVGKSLERLWFAENALFIYVSQSILACYIVERSDDGTPVLFWTESE